MEKSFAAAIARFGRLDILVNNAGISGANKPTHELSEAEWDQVQAVNGKGVFFDTKHAILAMRKSGGGSIIKLSSIYGLVGAPDVPPYHASKGAVWLMTKTDAMLYAGDRIRVNSIHPGFIWTPMVEKHLSSPGRPGRRAQGAGCASSLGPYGRARRHRLGRGLSRLQGIQVRHRRGASDRRRLCRALNGMRTR